MPYSKLTTKGQVTIPSSVRKKLHLKSGDTIEFTEKNGEIILKSIKKTVSDVFGVLSRKNQKPLSVEEMNNKIRQRFKS